VTDKRTYTCAACNRECVSDWSEEEAVLEARANFGNYVADNIEETCNPICDDCYKAFLIWRAGLSPEEERRLSERRS
jgi:hypothetical protein